MRFPGDLDRPSVIRWHERETARIMYMASQRIPNLSLASVCQSEPVSTVIDNYETNSAPAGFER